MYAIIESGGKQYTVKEGDIVRVEKLDVEEGATCKFDKVLLVNKDGELQVGKPYLEGLEVEAKVLRQGRARKVTIYKYNAKKNMRKKKGHRQPYTLVEIGKLA
ncbi:MAG: 50S ribosomal protein L21 [Tissierellia bacterium]|nr:50S ribosomal protein L21 [Tissierellia bacterium]